MFSQNPILFIIYVIGLAFVATMIWLGFYLTRQRPKTGDAEQAVVYANNTAARMYPSPSDGSQHLPPVYCVDHVAYPPPSYEAALARRDMVPILPPPHEVHIVRHPLEKLHCNRRRSSSSPADASAACETAMHNSQIRDLAQWVDRLERQRDDDDDDDDDDDEQCDGDEPAPLGRRRTVRVVQSEHEPATRRMRMSPEVGWPFPAHESMLHRSATEPGLVHCARWRNVAPPPTPTAAASSPMPGDMDIRIAVLREQLMRAASNRYSDRYSNRYSAEL